jgi:hypothetical protein
LYFLIDPSISTPRDSLVLVPIGYLVGYTLTWAFFASYWPALLTVVCIAIGVAPRPRSIVGLATLAAAFAFAISYGVSLSLVLSHGEEGMEAKDFIQLPPAFASALVLIGYYAFSKFKRPRRVA